MHLSFKRIGFGLVLWLFLTEVPHAAVRDGGFPDKPIKIVVPYPPGGFTDVLGRLIAEKLSVSFAQPVIVDNRGGGGSTIGSLIVAKAPADGYTLLLVAADLAINESLLQGKLPYDTRKDFAPVIQAARSPLVFVVYPSLKAGSIQEFIALAKAEPGKINVGSGGNGTGAHLALEMFKARAGIDVLHVPYKGNGPALTDLLGGQISAMFLPYPLARPHIEAGKLRVLGTANRRRAAAIPQVPTIAESGLPGFEAQSWFGIVAPAGTPAPIISRLNAEIAKVMRQPEIKEKLAVQGAESAASTPAEFKAFIGSEITRWAQVVKDSGAKAD